ncbi:MAG: hypothetical protein DHS20C18_23670 [Saprospiraceae bacterium]|nr:MAG: hypothetical protein DHS20C18_23670 [Saprospiraceae bacterium]
MNNAVVINVIRFLLILVFQGYVLKRISEIVFGGFYFEILFYPLFIMLLPFRTPRFLQLFLAFLMGICVDAFYDSPGVHASAAVFLAFIRPVILSWLAPRDGYNANYSPTMARYTFPWFLRYASLMLIFHLFFYFSVEAFTFVYIMDILLKTISSFVTSMVFIMVIMFSFNPVD